MKQTRARVLLTLALLLSPNLSLAQRVQVVDQSKACEMQMPSRYASFETEIINTESTPGVTHQIIHGGTVMQIDPTELTAINYLLRGSWGTLFHAPYTGKSTTQEARVRNGLNFYPVVKIENGIPAFTVLFIDLVRTENERIEEVIPLANVTLVGTVAIVTAKSDNVKVCKGLGRERCGPEFDFVLKQVPGTDYWTSAEVVSLTQVTPKNVCTQLQIATGETNLLGRVSLLPLSLF